MNGVSRRLRRESGAAMILTALAMMALLGITSLVIDIGNANQRAGTDQNISDAASLAAAWSLPETDAAKLTAVRYIAANLDAPIPIATWCPAEPDVTADTVCYRIGSRSIQVTAPWQGSSYLLRVEICDEVPTSFARVMGFDTIRLCRDATAEVEPPSPPSPGGPAIQAFSPDAKKALVTTSGARIWTNGSILIGSNNSGEAFDTDGTGGVSVVDGGEVWFNLQGGGCVNLPTCGPPGFLDPAYATVDASTALASGAQPKGCNPDQASLPAADRCAGASFFEDVYKTSAPSTIDPAALQVCLTSNGPACTAYDLAGNPVTHAQRFVYNFGDAAHVRTGTAANPTCANGYTDMWPGYYAERVKMGIADGCVRMNPGIYMFAKGWEACCNGYLQGNAVFLYNAHPGSNTAKVTKSAVCLTAAKDGPYANFLAYQNPANTSLFIITSDSVIHLGGIIYNPAGGVEVNGADAGTVGGPGQCLGQSTLTGGSIAGTTVKVKADGTLSITALSGGAASGGGGWVRLQD